MKVLLIYPPATHMITTNVPELVDEEIGYYPPLGLMYIAAYAERYTDHEIEILDAQVEGLTFTHIESEIRKRQPDVVGIQTMTFTLLDAIRTAETVKEVDRDIHICLGGPHVYIYPNETINIPEVDTLVLGEGEAIFTELIQALANGTDLDGIKGIVFKRNGEMVNTGLRPLRENLDELPYPARHLTPFRKYYSLVAKRSPITTMMTSRGCPYKCLFCDRPHLGKRFRARSAENVVDEMEQCTEMGIHEFFLYDDTFTVNRQRVFDVAEEILRRGLDTGWDIRARVDTVDREMLEKLKDAGCERIHYGVEAGTPEILRVLRKGIQMDRVREVFKITKDLGITTLAYFMIGSPTETREGILRTIEFAKELDPDYVHFSVTTPFPATELYYLGLEKGVLSHDYWRAFAAHPSEDFVPQLWEENLSREELIALLRRAYKSFYTRPNYVLQSLLKVKTLEEFKRKARAGLGVLRL